MHDRGIPDNIFDKVFRGVYQKEIEAFDIHDTAYSSDENWLGKQKNLLR